MPSRALMLLTLALTFGLTLALSPAAATDRSPRDQGRALGDLETMWFLPGADTWLEENKPADAHGSEPEVKVKSKVGDDRYALYRFDLASLPPGVRIAGAVFNLNCTGDDNTGLPVRVHPVVGTWDEATATWNTTASLVDTGSVRGSFVPITPGWYSVDVTALVQAWIDGDLQNHGLALAATSVGNESKFTTREDPNGGERSFLHIYLETSFTELAVAADSWIDENAPGDNRGDDVELRTRGGAPVREAALSRFELASLAPGRPYVAILELPVTAPDDSENPVLIRRIDASWTEFGVTWGNIAASIDGSTTWGQFSQDIPTTYQPAVTDLVRAWADGAYPNHGLALEATSSGIEAKYTSREWGAPSEHPRLWIADIGVDLGITKFVDDPAPAVADTVRYTVQVDNAGPHQATGVLVSDPLPPGISWLASGTTQGTYDRFSGVWSVGALAPLATAQLFIVAEVGPGTADSTIWNVAAVQAVDQPDTDPSNDSDSVAVVVQLTGVDVAVTKSVDDSTVVVGQEVLFTVAVENLGTEPATALRIVDRLPAGLSLNGASVTRGLFDGGTGSWMLPILVPGARDTLWIQAGVDLGTEGSRLENVAFVGSMDEIDVVPANDADSAGVTVLLADLEVTKSVDDLAPAEGDTLLFTVDLVNLGPTLAPAVSLVDSLPVGLTYVSDSLTVGSFDPGTGVWTVGDLAEGGKGTLWLAATVDPGTAGTKRANVARVLSSEAPDPDDTNDRDTATVTVAFADLEVVLGVDDPNPREGGGVTFGVQLTNLGSADADSVQVSFPLPAGLTWAGDTPEVGTYSSGTGTWNVGAVPNGTTVQLQVDATVVPGTGGTSLSAIASRIASSPPDPVPTNDVDSVAVVVQSADLIVTKTASDPSPNVGDGVIWTVTLRNAGPNNVLAATVVDSLPPGLAHVSDVPSTGSYDPGAGLWTVGAIDSGAVETLAILTAVSVGTGGSTITNTARVGTSDLPDLFVASDSMSASIDVQAADLIVSKTVNNPTPAVGSSITFTVGVENAGPDDATGVQVVDLLPAGLTFNGSAPSQGTYVDSTGVWNVGTIAAVDSARLSLVATVDLAAIGQHLVNLAAVAAVDQEDPSPGNEADSAAVDVSGVLPVEQADLAVTKNVSNPTPSVGDTVTWTVTVANGGPDAATSVEVADLLPSGLSFVSATPSVGTYDPAAGVWDVGTLALSGLETISLDTTIDTGTAGLTIVNAASASADQPDPDGIHSDTAAISVRNADLVLTKTVSDSLPTEGDAVTFTVIARNDGPNGTSAAIVADPLPAGLSFDSASASPGSYDEPSGLWTIGSLALGDSAALMLTATVDPGTQGTILTNVASVLFSAEGDSLPGNNADSAAVRVRSADLVVAVVVDDPAPAVGDSVAFTVAVGNFGPDDAAGITVTDALPAGLIHVSGVPSRGTWDGGSGVWTVGGLSAGTNELLVITAEIAPGMGGSTLWNAAGISATDTADPVSMNNADSTSVSVIVSTGIFVAATQSDRVIRPGRSGVLLTVALANSLGSGRELQQLRLTNVTAGPGTVAQRDAELGTVQLRADDGDGIYQANRDPLVATATAASGEVPFTGLSLATPPGTVRMLHVVAQPSLGARDGDLLDVRIDGPAQVVFGSSVPFLNAWPVDPVGSSLVDGLVAAQLSIVDLGDSEVPCGATRVPALGAVLPPNGYEADTLLELRVANLGTAAPGTEVTALKWWTDGGDGAFDGGSGDDTFLGTAVFGSGVWALAGLSLPLPVSGQGVWASVDLNASGQKDRTIRLVFPGPGATGVVTASGNSGPLDAASGSSGTLTLVPPPTRITVWALDQDSGPALPGAKLATVFDLRLVNESAVAETLRALSVANGTAGGPGATQADLDAEWQLLEIVRVRGSDIGGVGGADPGGAASGGIGRQTDGVFVDGLTTFTVDEELAPGDTAVFRIRGAASVVARDGDVLDLFVPGGDALVFDGAVDLIGSFPLDPPGAYPVDGMSIAQVSFGPVGPSLLTGTTRNVAMDVVLPANGYEDDTLLRFDVINLGDAQPADDIERVELWRDDGDGTFDPLADTALGEMQFTGNRWERTGLNQALAAGVGARLWVTVDIADLALAGRAVQLALPGPPDPGVGFASDNDGPVDGVASGSQQTISTVDRVTFSPVAVASGSAAPGDVDVLLLALAAENFYGEPKTLTALTVDNATAGPGAQAQLDAEVARVTLWADDGDGLFEGAPADTAIGVSFFDGGSADFTGLVWTVAPDSTRQLFVSGDLSGPLAADGDSIAVLIADPASVTFAAPTALAASWPLDSGARAVVDGMVAQQITRFVAPAATLGPGEGPALALDIVIPGNGYLADTLNGFAARNLGTAGAADLADVRLWRDGGDGVFDAGAGDDLDLGALGLFGGQWVQPVLSETIPAGGVRMFVSVTSSSTPTDSSSVRFAVPVDGLEMASANDGPKDAQVANPETILLSTAVLLASIEISPTATTVDSTVTATMTVRNLHTTATMDSVMPSALQVLPSTGLAWMSGPVPALATLAPFEETTFEWTYRAAFIGESRLRGSVSGRETGGGPAHQSLEVLSNAVQVFVGSQSLDLYAVASMPFSISRGQRGVVPLTLTFENPGGASGTDIRLEGLRFRLEDEQGVGIVPAALLSRVVVNEGAVVYLDKTSIETTGAEVDLTLASPVLIESSGSSSQATIGIALDVSDSTSVPNFVVKILDATWFSASDATTGGPVSVTLQDPPVFPISSGLARVVAEATRLDISGTAAGDFPAGQGQQNVAVLDFVLDNPDPSGLAADVRIPSFEISLVDSAGAPVVDPAAILDRIRVRTPNQLHLDRPVGAGDGATLPVTLATLISVPVNTPVPVTIEVDIATGAALGSFRTQLADTSAFEARDANTGAPLPVFYSPDPLTGPVMAVQAPADTLSASGVARMPASVPVGSEDVPALAVILEHPGGAQVGPVLAGNLTLGCRDDANGPIVPATVLHRISVWRGGVEVGVVTGPPTSGGEVTIDLTGVVIPPGGRDSLEVRFDVEVTAPATLFQMTVAASGIDAMDANLMLPVTVAAANGTEFPLSSGLTQLSLPARTLAVGFTDGMPPVLAADGSAFRPATLTLRNDAPASAGQIRVGSVTVRAADGAGNEIDLGAVASAVTAWRGDEMWAEHADLVPTDGQAVLVAADTLALSPAESEPLVIELALRPGASSEGLRIGFRVEDVGVVQPGSPLLSISVLGDGGQSFPFWTAAGNFGGTTLADSYSNFPNPFAAGREPTTITFYLPQPGSVSLKVYTLRGEIVRTLLAGESLGAGLHQETTWDGRNGRGNVVTNGTYVAEIAVQWDDGGTERLLRKVAVVR